MLFCKHTAGVTALNEIHLHHSVVIATRTWPVSTRSMTPPSHNISERTQVTVMTLPSTLLAVHSILRGSCHCHCAHTYEELVIILYRGIHTVTD